MRKTLAERTSRCLITSVALVLPLLVIGCRDNGVQPGYDMVNFTGTVILESAQTYLIRSDVPYQNTVTFYPLNLAAPYRQNGLRIRFSANVEVEPVALQTPEDQRGMERKRGF